jgi:hypothetical protein
MDSPGFSAEIFTRGNNGAFRRFKRRTARRPGPPGGYSRHAVKPVFGDDAGRLIA